MLAVCDPPRYRKTLHHDQAHLLPTTTIESSALVKKVYCGEVGRALRGAFLEKEGLWWAPRTAGMPSSEASAARGRPRVTNVAAVTQTVSIDLDPAFDGERRQVSR